MPYFRREFVKFFNALEVNNNRTWFSAHRKEYEECVREPFKSLVADLLRGLENIDPDIQMSVKDALFRINRENRNKQTTLTYHTHIAAGFSKGGRKSPYAGYFIDFGHKHVFIGGGAPFLPKESLKKIRIEIASRANEFNRIITAKQFTNTFTHLLGENTNDLAGELHKLYSRYPVVGNKQFYYVAMYRAEEVLYRDDLEAFILKHFATGEPVNRFLKSALDTIRYPGLVVSS